MIPLKTTLVEDRSRLLAPLVEGLWVPPLIRPVLYGEMGYACVDRADEPTVCCLTLSDFVFYAGDASSPTARYFLATTARPCYVLPSTRAWAELTREEAQTRGKVHTRCSFSSETLDRAELQEAATSTPLGYEVRRFDEETVSMAVEEHWSRSLVENFPSVDYFLDAGLGFGVFDEDTLVCGASSFAVYRNVVEIEVDTHPDYRRRGLAAAVSARLVVHCLDHDLLPHWDAANEASRALAGKLGFDSERCYEVLEI